MSTPIASEPTLAGPRTAGAVERLLPRLGRETAYSLAGFPVAIAAFVVVVTGLSTGGGLLVTLVGFPVLTLTAFAARGFAEVERRLLRDVLRRDAPTPAYRRAHPGEGVVRRIFVPLGDPQSWLDMLHSVVGFVTATISFSVVLTWWASAVGGLLYPVWGWALPRGSERDTLPELLGLGDSYTLDVVFNMSVGALCLITLPWVVRAMTVLRAGPAAALLASRAETQQQVRELRATRDAARSAEATALRRLERDIHDGPQQRLVRLSMDLGRASKQAATVAPELQPSIDGALRQTRDALDELRALSRGIAPPILADRGLAAALEELVVRSSVPVELRVDLGDAPLPAHAETAAYFVVSEALTNVAKHSGARHAQVAVTLHDGWLRVRVTDDGRGGAHLSKGKGLLGLSDRVRGVDGVLNVESPAGGPTVLDAEIPCAS